MRIGSCDRFWCVIDAADNANEADVCWSSTLLGLERWMRGGDPADQVRMGLTIYVGINAAKSAELDCAQRLRDRDARVAARR